MHLKKNTDFYSIIPATVKWAVKPLVSSTLIGLIAFSSAGIALADLVGDQRGDGHHMSWGDGSGIMIFGPLMMIGLVAVIVLVVMLLMSRGKSVSEMGGTAQGQYPLAVAILDERYAKGEIDGDEYAERKRVLLAKP